MGEPANRQNGIDFEYEGLIDQCYDCSNFHSTSIFHSSISELSHLQQPITTSPTTILPHPLRHPHSHPHPHPLPHPRMAHALRAEAEDGIPTTLHSLHTHNANHTQVRAFDNPNCVEQPCRVQYSIYARLREAVSNTHPHTCDSHSIPQRTLPTSLLLKHYLYAHRFFYVKTASSMATIHPFIISTHTR